MEVGPSVGSDGTCGELGIDFDVNLKVMCWNVCGWFVNLVEALIILILDL